jgi:hypothetical protein
MPSESPWPIVLALCLALVFVFLLSAHPVWAAVFLGGALAALGAWHWKEPVQA